MHPALLHFPISRSMLPCASDTSSRYNSAAASSDNLRWPGWGLCHAQHVVDQDARVGSLLECPACRADISASEQLQLPPRMVVARGEMATTEPICRRAAPAFVGLASPGPALQARHLQFVHSLVACLRRDEDAVIAGRHHWRNIFISEFRGKVSACMPQMLRRDICSVTQRHSELTSAQGCTVLLLRARAATICKRLAEVSSRSSALWRTVDLQRDLSPAQEAAAAKTSCSRSAAPLHCCTGGSSMRCGRFHVCALAVALPGLPGGMQIRTGCNGCRCRSNGCMHVQIKPFHVSPLLRMSRMVKNL